MGDQALGVAEIVGDAHDLERVLERKGAFLAAGHFEGHERRAAAHLLLDDRGLRMVVPARIDQPRHLRMLGERIGDLGRGLGLRAHPHRQRLQPFQHDPGVERRHRRAGLADEARDVVGDELLRAEDDAAEAAALAVDVLGGGIDHAVGAQFERALPQRRREHVVDDERRAAGVRDLGDLGDVEHIEIGIGRRLQEAGLGVRAHRRAPLVEIEAIDDGRRDAVARQVFLDHVEVGAEDRLRRNDVIAGLDLAEDRQRHRGHARR